MKRIECGIAAGFLAAAIGFACMGASAADDAKSKSGPIRAKSTLSAHAPLLGRMVVRPSAEQMAQIRRERQMMGFENRTSDGKKAGNIHAQVESAL